jgi:hypothetical protein
MDAITYLDMIVDPTIAEFQQAPANRRRAFLACVATYHVVDYLTPGKSSGNLRRKLGSECQEFALIDRAAHAFKHMQGGNADDPIKPELKILHIFERPPAMAGIMQCGISRLGDTTGGVAIWGEEGPDLLPAVKMAAAFLREKAQSGKIAGG